MHCKRPAPSVTAAIPWVLLLALCLVPLPSHGQRSQDVLLPDDVPVITNPRTEVFDLRRLEDGESRSFGTGEDRLLVSRHGHQLTISGAATTSRESASLECDLRDESCRVLQEPDGSQATLIVERRPPGYRGRLVWLRCPRKDVLVGVSPGRLAEDLLCPRHGLPIALPGSETHSDGE